MKAYRALICDLDMTLVDSRADIAAAIAHSAAEVCGAVLKSDDIVPLIGRSLRAMFAVLLPPSDNGRIAACVEEYKRYFFDHCAEQTRPYPGVVETLTTVRERGIKTAVATTKMTFMARRVCELTGLAPLFDHIQGTDDFAPKPDPEVIIRACAALGVEPAHSLLIGDTVMDIRAARAAGCGRVAAVSYGIGTTEALLAEAPNRLLDRFVSLLDESLF